jgi:hypothetical protein
MWPAVGLASAVALIAGGIIGGMIGSSNNSDSTTNPELGSTALNPGRIELVFPVSH